ncbi:hypothetical protein AVEN_157636-1, partial [Araneus ventricosus]
MPRLRSPIRTYTRTEGRLQRYNVGAPFERMALDILVPFTVTTKGDQYVLALMDYFTKWPEAIPIPDQEDSTVAEELDKEEHLLPPPYQTDCSYNGPSKDDRESTNPNSYEMCLDMCRSEYAKAYTGCDWGITMIPSVRDLCYVRDYKRPNISLEQDGELQDKRLICFQNCKQGCLKLQYKYRIKETQDSWDKSDIGKDRAALQRIVLNSDLQVSLRPYRTSPIEEQEIYLQVEELLQAGLMKLSNSTYSSPIYHFLLREKSRSHSAKACSSLR